MGRSSAILMILTYYSSIINAEQRLNAMFCWILLLLARYVSMTEVKLSEEHNIQVVIIQLKILVCKKSSDAIIFSYFLLSFKIHTENVE